MDLDPDTGSYRLSANVPRVEVNDLRKTLGVKPPPLPVGGALRGVLHCTGPLERPVFSGEDQPGIILCWVAVIPGMQCISAVNMIRLLRLVHARVIALHDVTAGSDTHDCS